MALSTCPDCGGGVESALSARVDQLEAGLARLAERERFLMAPLREPGALGFHERRRRRSTGLRRVRVSHILPPTADPRARPARAAGFAWDAGNAATSRARHEVSRAGCEQVFVGAPLALVADRARSGREDRSFALGLTDGERLLLVVFTLRGPLVRDISDRPMSRGEREVHRDARAQEDAE